MNNKLQTVQQNFHLQNYRVLKIITFYIWLNPRRINKMSRTYF